MPLQVEIGYATSAGVRERNEDFLGCVTPVGGELLAKGVLAALADGVSGHAGGREAAEYAVRGLLADYYATPDTWQGTVALDQVLQAMNRWVMAQARSRPELTGMATTLTALLVRGRRMLIAHVGDTRAYRLRRGGLRRLTTDHVWDRPDMAHVLTRAVGLDVQLRVDYHDHEVEIGDRYLLVSDGVWASLRDAGIQIALTPMHDPQGVADHLVAEALRVGSRDNVSALVLDVNDLPADTVSDLVARAAELLPPPPLAPGALIDGMRVLECMHRSRDSRLYRVERADGSPAVLKTLSPQMGADAAVRRQFAYEEWLARRAVARFFAQVLPSEGRSALYYLQSWHAGRTLAERLAAGAHIGVPEFLAMAEKLVRAVGALHRRSIVHRDLKPENVHIGDDGELRILDFGVAESGVACGSQPSLAGTPSYLAPELFDGASAGPATDLYALSVTLYFALTRRYPYGEIEPFQRPHFGAPVTAARYRPDLPEWLNQIMLKAVARDPRQRFETAEEMLFALQRGPALALEPASRALAQRDPLAFWRGVSLLLAIAVVLLGFALIAR